VAWDEAYLRTKWHLDPHSRLATIHMGRKLAGGAVPPIREELGPHLTQCGRDDAYLHAKFHLDPSSRLATIHQRRRNSHTNGQDTNGQDRQRSDTIGRTVLQTVAQRHTHR